MAVDLSDLVPSLKREVSVPGASRSIYPTATTTEWTAWLSDAFWEVRMDGMLGEYTEADGIVTPINPSDPDLSRDWQQVIVLYAGIRITRNELLTLDTVFRSKAGPVEYETGKSAQLLQAILQELQGRRDQVLETLSGAGQLPSYYIDAVLARDVSVATGLTQHTRG